MESGRLVCYYVLAFVLLHAFAFAIYVLSNKIKNFFILIFCSSL